MLKSVGFHVLFTLDLSSVDFRQFNMWHIRLLLIINDIPLIKKVASEGKPVIISTGLANLGDIELAIETCNRVGNDQIVLLKCVSEYPTPYEDINLKTMVNMKETFGCVVGLSDHSLGGCVSIAAVALGAKVIEKHLTLSRKDGGADSDFSMEPDEFGRMVQDIRNVEKSLGNVTYGLTNRQKMSKKRARSLYVVADIATGQRLTPENIKSIRPGYGLHTKYYEEVLGKTVNCDLKKGTALQWKYID